MELGSWRGTGTTCMAKRDNWVGLYVPKSPPNSNSTVCVDVGPIHRHQPCWRGPLGCQEDRPRLRHSQAPKTEAAGQTEEDPPGNLPHIKSDAGSGCWPAEPPGSHPHPRKLSLGYFQVHIVQIQMLGYKKNCRRNLRLPWERPCKGLRNEPPHYIAGP